MILMPRTAPRVETGPVCTYTGLRGPRARPLECPRSPRHGTSLPYLCPGLGPAAHYGGLPRRPLLSRPCDARPCLAQKSLHCEDTAEHCADRGSGRALSISELHAPMWNLQKRLATRCDFRAGAALTRGGLSLPSEP